MTVLNSIMHTAKAQSSFMVGGFGAAAAFSGLYGPIIGVPTSLLSLMFLPMAALALWFAGLKAPPPLAWLGILSSIIIYLLILGHASPFQFAFMFDPSQWHLREERYIDAKLLAISIAFVPQLFALIMVAFARGRREAIEGVFFALCVLATLAALRILVEQGEGLIRTDKITASNALLSSRYSLVSYGLLLTIGSVSSLIFKRGWVLSGILLFFAALICRRADVISLMISLVALSIYFSLSQGVRIGSTLLYPLALGVVLFAGLHNEYNISYFSAIGRAIELRTDMVSESLSALSEEKDHGTNDSPANPPITSPKSEEQSPVIERKNYVNNSSTIYPSTDKAEKITDNQSQKKYYGLGYYSHITNSKFLYPHNMAIEFLIEIGILSFILFLFLILFPVIVFIYNIKGRSNHKYGAFAIASLCIGIIFSFKAGEMSSLGRVTFLTGFALLACQCRERRESELQSLS